MPRLNVVPDVREDSKKKCHDAYVQGKAYASHIEALVNSKESWKVGENFNVLKDRQESQVTF